MQITNLTLAYQILELQELIGGYINKIQQIEKDIFRFRIHTKHGTKNLIVNPSTFYISQYKLAARKNPAGFPSFLHKHLYNKRIISLKQHEADRIAVLEFTDFFLILEFFHDSNIILTNKEMEILSAFKKQEWKDRIIKKGEIYKFPSSKGINPKTITLKELTALFAESSNDAIRTLVSGVNIAPIAAEESLFISGIEKNEKAKKLDQKQLKKLHSAIKETYSEAKKPDLKPVIAGDLLLPFHFKSINGDQPRTQSLNEAMDEHFSESLSERKLEPVKAEKEKQIKRTEFSLKQQLQAKEKFEKSVDESKKKAELIYENYSELQELVDAINSAISKGAKEKEIMYKMDLAAKKGNKAAKLFSSIDLKKKELVVEL